MLLSDYVCLLACFFGNTVNTTEWCMKILSLTSSQVTAMPRREERRNSEKGEVQDVDELKHTQSRKKMLVNSRRESMGEKSNCITFFQIAHLAKLTWECAALGAGAWPRTKRRCHALCWLPVNLLIKNANGCNCSHS